MDTSAVINVNVQSNDTPQAQYKTVVLKPNMVDDVNTLTQAMLTVHGQNTKFVIKYDYTLGEDITVPANCVLEFDGGSLNSTSSETVAFNECTIVGNNSGILNVEIAESNGTIANNKINALWFKPASDGYDISTALQRADTVKKQRRYLVPEPKFGTLSIGQIDVPFGRYSINTPVTLYYGGIIDFNNSYIDSLATNYILNLIDGSFIVKNINFKEVDKCVFINTWDVDFTKITLFNCNFNWCNTCIDTDDFENSRSTMMVVDSCYFIQSQTCILSWVDKLNVVNSWFYPRPGLDNAMMTVRGLSTISKCVFVPTTGTANARYIDFVEKDKSDTNLVENFGLTIDNCRFSAESTNFPILRNYVDYSISELQRYSFIDIHDCFIEVTGGNKTIIELYNLPGLIKIDNIVGVVGEQTLIKTASEFDLSKYSFDKKRIIIGDFVDNGYYTNVNSFVSAELLPITKFADRKRIDRNMYGNVIHFASYDSYHLIGKSIDNTTCSATILLSKRTYSNTQEKVGLFRITKVSATQVYFYYEDFGGTVGGEDISEHILVNIDNGYVYVYAKSPNEGILMSTSIGVISSNNIEFYNEATQVVNDTTELQKANKIFMSGTSRPYLSARTGYMFFDETLGKPIWHKGNEVWVDATGTPV